MSNENNATDLRPYSVKEIASIYNVCDKTLKKWLKPHEPLIGVKLGLPGKVH
jgi:transposase-like protein